MRLSRIFALLYVFLTVAAFSQSGIIAGTEQGLFRITRTGAVKIQDISGVRKILRTPAGWYVMSAAGILFSADLASFEERNSGLPQKVIKTWENGVKGFHREIQELKDLEVHPDNPLILVTATKDSVYITRDGGHNWKSAGLSAATTGAKAVAIASLPDSTGAEQLVLFMSHPIYGISWKYADSSKPVWADMPAGLDKVPSIKWPDEVADITAIRKNGKTEIYVSQTFMPRIYRLDWTGKKFDKIWTGPGFIDTTESISVTDKGVLFVSPGMLREIPASAPATVLPAARISDWDLDFALAPSQVQCAWIPEERTGGRGDVSLTELWLLAPEKRYSTYAQTANLKKGNYIPVHQVTSEAGYNAHMKTLKDNGLNMLVIDMKDDFGIIRYDTRDPLVMKKGKTGRGIHLESFVKKAKENGIYLVARIVVFKDKSLASWNKSQYAVWDKLEEKPWQGYEMITRKVEVSEGGEPATEKVRKYYEEYWVDPYSEEVWEYNIAISRELIQRGFDEIQFDYIRFPTDGANLSNTSYRWQESGMDKESALMSFLSYARKEIDAPISIDIYGANGWYRTGSRTGQDVELLARYVDAICPMFYPSHFEQNFLAHNPAAERPYRIYYYGSYRNAIIARNHVIIRPWAQAFYLNVSYDRTWYNQDYVQRQIFGIRDSINQGYTYWNNSGRYGDLRPDIGIDQSYPWTLPEAAAGLAKPAFGGN